MLKSFSRSVSCDVDRLDDANNVFSIIDLLLINSVLHLNIVDITLICEVNGVGIMVIDLHEVGNSP
jgi:hypothetical protein